MAYGKPDHWPDGTPRNNYYGQDPDPRDPQLPSGTRQVGKSFAYRPELLTRNPRGQTEGVLFGPGSEQWRRGQDDVWAKRSYTLGQVNPRRR